MWVRLRGRGHFKSLALSRRLKFEFFIITTASPIKRRRACTGVSASVTFMDSGLWVFCCSRALHLSKILRA